MRLIHRLINKWAENRWRVEVRCNCEETGETYKEFDWDHHDWFLVAKKCTFEQAVRVLHARAMQEDTHWLLRMRNGVTGEIIPGEALGL